MVSVSILNQRRVKDTDKMTAFVNPGLKCRSRVVEKNEGIKNDEHRQSWNSIVPCDLQSNRMHHNKDSK
jgi:hypothetical protein